MSLQRRIGNGDPSDLFVKTPCKNDRRCDWYFGGGGGSGFLKSNIAEPLASGGFEEILFFIRRELFRKKVLFCPLYADGSEDTRLLNEEERAR